jgi:hypothetical protein
MYTNFHVGVGLEDADLNKLDIQEEPSRLDFRSTFGHLKINMQIN